MQDAQALQHMDICEHVPRLTDIGLRLLGQESDSRIPAEKDDKPQTIRNADLLLQFVEKYIFGGQNEDALDNLSMAELEPVAKTT